MFFVGGRETRRFQYHQNVDGRPVDKNDQVLEHYWPPPGSHLRGLHALQIQGHLPQWGRRFGYQNLAGRLKKSHLPDQIVRHHKHSKFYLPAFEYDRESQRTDIADSSGKTERADEGR